MNSDKILYHYTDILAAISIMQSGVLYFKHHQKMNDRTEFSYADGLLHEYAELALDEIFKKERTLGISLKGTKYNQAVKYESKKWIKTLSEGVNNDYYIFSSTQHTDSYDKENGSLVMWRGYGKDNGCAIVFDKEKLITLADDLQKNSRVFSTVDGKVAYLKEPKEIEKEFPNEYRVFVNYLKYLMTFSYNPEEKPLYNQVDGLTSYITMKALIKHHAFKSENEYRFSMLRSIPNINAGDSKLIPVENDIIKLPIAKNSLPIKKIIVSPFYNQDKNYKILSDFVKSSPEYLKISITKSKIPHA